MKLKIILSWALIFSFTFSMFTPFVEAGEIKAQQIKAYLAKEQARLDRIHKDLVNFKDQTEANKKKLAVLNKAKAVDEGLMLVPEDSSTTEDVSESASTDNSTDTSDSSSGTTSISTSDETQEIDRSKMKETFIGIDAPEKGYIGDIIPITVAVVIRDDVELDIDKIDLLISDPKSGKDFFKDSYDNNVRKQKKMYFTYYWDTDKAETNLGSHTITVKVYEKKDNKSQLFDKPVTMKIQMQSDPGIDISKHGFWNAYLKADTENNDPKVNTLNSYWKKKLDCGSDDCTTRAQIREHLDTAIENGDFSTKDDGTYIVNDKFNQADKIELDSSFTRYLNYLKKNKPTEEKDKIAASANTLIMTDLNNYVQEKVNESMGINSPDLSEETATAPELHTAINVYNKYAVKLAAYEPQSYEELKKLPFYNEMEKEIADNISKDPDDQIDSINDLNIKFKDDVSETDIDTDSSNTDSETSFNLLAPKRAKAIAPALVVAGAVIGVAVTVWDVYKLIREPSWGNLGMVALDILLLPLGGASLGEKLLVKAGAWLGRVLKIGQLIGRVAEWWKTTKVCQFIGDLWAAVKGWKIWESPIIKTIVSTVKEWASQGWAALSGFFKKAFSYFGFFFRWGAYFSARAWWKDTACPGFLTKIVDPFSWALCNILKFFYDLSVSIFTYSLCLFRHALGTGVKPKACEFNFGG